MKKTFSWIFRLILKYSQSKKSHKLFLLISNIRFKILRLEIRFLKISENEFDGFQAVDYSSNTSSFFINRFQGYYSYHNGMNFRANEMGKEIYMLDEINFFPNDIIFDVGANLGDLNLFFNLNKIEVKYYGFEPGKDEFICLKKNIPKSFSAKLFPIALGNKSEETFFYYKPNNADNSIVPIDNYTEKYMVSVKTLDEIIIENGLVNTKIKFLKLEAEGYEPEILYGLKKHLNNIEYISADLGFERGVKEETTSPDVINFLLKNNFEIIRQSNNRNTFLFRSTNNFPILE